MEVKLMTERIVEIINERGKGIDVPLSFDGERESAMLVIDGVRYHFERIEYYKLVSEYAVDLDPDYDPESDEAGYCYILAPFCK